MPDDHLPDEVILGVLDHAKSHNMEESIAFSVGHHGVGTGHPDQLLKNLSVQLGGCDMNRRFAGGISHEGTGFAVLEQGVDHEGVATEDGLIEGEFAARIYLRSLFLHDHVEDAEVQIP